MVFVYKKISSLIIITWPGHMELGENYDCSFPLSGIGVFSPSPPLSLYLQNLITLYLG